MDSSFSRDADKRAFLVRRVADRIARACHILSQSLQKFSIKRAECPGPSTSDAARTGGERSEDENNTRARE